MFPQAKKIKGQLPLNEQGDQETCLLSMTPTRLALLSPAAGSRQCRAGTDLGRGPHVSSSLLLHLPISPLPSSLLSLSLPSFFHLSLSPSFLTIHLLHPFLLFLLFLKICSFHIPSTNPPWRRQTKSSQPQEAAQPLAKLDAINTGVAEELHASPATPSTPPRRSSTVWSAHPSSPQRECRPAHPCSRHDTDESHEEAVSKASMA